jgi:hypothetical protein
MRFDTFRAGMGCVTATSERTKADIAADGCAITSTL